MAYDRQFIKITWGFLVASSDEIADTSINYSSAPAWSGAVAALEEIGDTAGWGGDLITAMETFASIGSFNWANYSTVNSVKVAAIGTDGAYLTEPLVYENETPTPGGSTGTLPQSTVVLSLRSGFTLGQGNYGRMYIPHTRLTMATGTAKSSPTYTDPAAASGATFVNAVTAVVDDETTATLFPVIMSQAGITSKGVTEVAVGDVTDTQRRRRNRLQEVYSFEPLA